MKSELKWLIFIYGKGIPEDRTDSDSVNRTIYTNLWKMVWHRIDKLWVMAKTCDNPANTVHTFVDFHTHLPLNMFVYF